MKEKIKFLKGEKDFYEFVSLVRIMTDINECKDCREDCIKQDSDEAYLVSTYAIEALEDGIRNETCHRSIIGAPRVIKIVKTSICWSNTPAGGRRFWYAYIFLKTPGSEYKEEKYIAYLVSPKLARSCNHIVIKQPILIPSLERSSIVRALKINPKKFNYEHCSYCGAKLDKEPSYYECDEDPVWVCPKCGSQNYY